MYFAGFLLHYNAMIGAHVTMRILFILNSTETTKMKPMFSQYIKASL